METQYFVGIDIYKESLNWAVCSANKIILEQVSGNDIKSITKTVISLLRQLNIKLASAVFCMEYTPRGAPWNLSHSLTEIFTEP
jgi:transposase